MQVKKLINNLVTKFFTNWKMFKTTIKKAGLDLFLVLRNQGITPKQIQVKTGQSYQHISTVLTSFEAQGLIIKEFEKGSSVNFTVNLTEKGTAAVRCFELLNLINSDFDRHKVTVDKYLLEDKFTGEFE